MLRAIAQQQRRTLFSSSRVSKQFVVIARDFDDAEALERRLAVREKHLNRILPKVDEGRVLLGGGILDSHESGKMLGSCLIVDAESKEQVQQLLEEDPYVKGKVWKDWDIYPFNCAVGKLGK
ncbi:hypothetical protein LRAMOSA06014 [Lichtheimia ramosa]|uniref:YCII-related domain-containing protein n=1 Tax=Lichtheimia ramosa TaxID=688394 RepID=A0A077X2M5_9FUNG|nr:hypothetical protein LRAMOSA06014 [Lichtheimia ramosa]